LTNLQKLIKINHLIFADQKLQSSHGNSQTEAQLISDDDDDDAVHQLCSQSSQSTHCY